MIPWFTFNRCFLINFPGLRRLDSGTHPKIFRNVCSCLAILKPELIEVHRTTRSSLFFIRGEDGGRSSRSTEGLRDPTKPTSISLLIPDIYPVGPRMVHGWSMGRPQTDPGRVPGTHKRRTQVVEVGVSDTGGTGVVCLHVSCRKMRSAPRTTDRRVHSGCSDNLCVLAPGRGP